MEHTIDVHTHKIFDVTFIFRFEVFKRFFIYIVGLYWENVGSTTKFRRGQLRFQKQIYKIK